MIIPYNGIHPRVHPSALIQESAQVIGDVEIGAESSVWFQAVVRGDVNYIRIGEQTNIQDGCVIHVTLKRWPTFIGFHTTVGHRAVIHGARVGDYCLIGMGAIILDGADVGDYCLVAAGAVVPPGMKVPTRSLVMGVPGKVVRELSPEDIERIENQGREYLHLIQDYKQKS